MKTERVTLLISPNDKRELQNLAEDRGITASELVRRAVHAFGATSADETQELAALTAELRAAIPGMRKSLRDANLTAERAIAAIGRSRGAVANEPSRQVAEARKRYRAR
ncbi:MAG TPA: ribbon-helix-helix protein, CopG family [Rudaea sp.]|nr:ribbon-helix-helix protein, CopG family [Rudaea sp.]